MEMLSRPAFPVSFDGLDFWHDSLKHNYSSVSKICLEFSRKVNVSVDLQSCAKAEHMDVVYSLFF